MTQASNTLTVTLPSDLEIRMTRTFTAPCELVFDAHTSCEHLRRWWGGRSTMTVCDLDHRPGGVYRFVLRDDAGTEFGFRGTYREIDRPGLIVQTFEFDGMPGHVSTETLTFEGRDGITTLTSNSVFDSVEDRNGMLESGMEAGATESMDALAAYLESQS